MTFVERCLADPTLDPRDVMLDDVDRWHCADLVSCCLHEHLGITRDEYAAWVEGRLTARQIVEARR